jgi:hypothetical protein
MAGSMRANMDTSILNEVVEQLRVMSPSLQQQVLDFARTLTGSIVQGVPGSQLLHFAGTIQASDLELMRQAIEHDCEQVDLNEW